MQEPALPAKGRYRQKKSRHLAGIFIQRDQLLGSSRQVMLLM